ncbi:hypothetical protein Maes01_02067 [Microbulbifer aestuariivivens]|uniref:FecR N-terminal domain-containing protein n=1 Tax=Microbulbifer aestuariivivens TaxID=1908308 RepID=A0ABP9WQL7_9GAMM
MQLDEWLCIGIPEDVMEQASAWLARLDADHVSLDEQQLLAAWLDEDPLHRWAFEELSQLYARVASLSHMRGQIHAPRVMIFPQVSPPPQPPVTQYAQIHAPHWQSVLALVLIAAGLILALTLQGPAAATGNPGNTCTADSPCVTSDAAGSHPAHHNPPTPATEQFQIHGE